jgi:hypothetical protein
MARGSYVTPKSQKAKETLTGCRMMALAQTASPLSTTPMQLQTAKTPLTITVLMLLMKTLPSNAMP